ncbi:SPOR domain-containing protein [Atopomonas sediminilitoris]|uniref:SPOR domain-containing protein n=1 Tax=Atopomonas sediminilitoris TaxID=2919919 RepID=UPI001F4DB892|nr:SPOR domain-containing protein [Atopomonas sediminilitoris]MCJ8169801.1 SPOR domain-containing protein [Atopomonas sediminilitoris]
MDNDGKLSISSGMSANAFQDSHYTFRSLTKSANTLSVKVFLIVVFLILAGCKPSIERIESDTKTSIQETLDSDKKYSKYGMQVDSVSVVMEEGNRYKGIAYISLEEAQYPIAITVISDGEKLIWSAGPGQFAFLVQHEWRKVQAAITENLKIKQSDRDSLEWVVQIATLSNRDAAERLVSDLAKTGHKAYIITSEGFNRVFVGPMARRGEADLLRNQIKLQHKLNGFVVIYKDDK